MVIVVIIAQFFFSDVHNALISHLVPNVIHRIIFKCIIALVNANNTIIYLIIQNALVVLPLLHIALIVVLLDNAHNVILILIFCQIKLVFAAQEKLLLMANV